MNRLSVLLLACSLAGSTTSAFTTPSRGGSLLHQTPSRYDPSHQDLFTRPRGRSHTTTSSKRHTELSAALLPPGKFTAIGMGIGKFYKASPLIAGFLTASTKASFADSMAQYRDTGTTKFDIKRNLAMVLYSGTILGLDWNGGSSLFFWRWPESHIRWAREGQPHFVTGELPRFEEAQRKSATEESQALVQAKVNKVRRRMYIAPGLVLILTHMFDVPKPPSDIRMVYDGTASGLNDALFAPHFTLPVVENTMRSLLENYYAADLDVGCRGDVSELAVGERSSIIHRSGRDSCANKEGVRQGGMGVGQNSTVGTLGKKFYGIA
eukprot:scaffold2427_cov153-Skeletonema_marinoi.AAC.2